MRPHTCYAGAIPNILVQFLFVNYTSTNLGKILEYFFLQKFLTSLFCLCVSWFSGEKFGYLSSEFFQHSFMIKTVSKSLNFQGSHIVSRFPFLKIVFKMSFVKDMDYVGSKVIMWSRFVDVIKENAVTQRSWNLVFLVLQSYLSNNLYEILFTHPDVLEVTLSKLYVASNLLF
jgi:hypothetical protein